jgi:transcriptional repressor BetI
MEPIRRRQLIDATVATIHRYGYGKATLARIAEEAGLSPGIVAHYFEDKAGLMEATMRDLVEGLRRQVVAELACAATPRARLEAIIESNFSPAQCAPDLRAVWLAFWAQVLQTPRLARIQRIYRRRLISNLRHALKALLPLPQASEAAQALAALIDGLWLQSALSEGALSPQEARRIALDFLDRTLEYSDPTAALTKGRTAR